MLLVSQSQHAPAAAERCRQRAKVRYVSTLCAPQRVASLWAGRVWGRRWWTWVDCSGDSDPEAIEQRPADFWATGSWHLYAWWQNSEVRKSNSIFGHIFSLNVEHQHSVDKFVKLLPLTDWLLSACRTLHASSSSGNTRSVSDPIAFTSEGRGMVTRPKARERCCTSETWAARPHLWTSKHRYMFASYAKIPFNAIECDFDIGWINKIELQCFTTVCTETQEIWMRYSFSEWCVFWRTELTHCSQ